MGPEITIHTHGRIHLVFKLLLAIDIWLSVLTIKRILDVKCSMILR